MTEIIKGDCRTVLPTLPAGRFRCCVTSPPYWMQREYLPADHPNKALEIGREKTPELYVETLVGVFRDVRRTLSDDGTLWLNVANVFWGGGGGNYGNGKSVVGSVVHPTNVKNRYNPPGIKPKDLVGVAWMLALALQKDGWWLRADNVWGPPNAVPESVRDRPTIAHEYVMLLAKSRSYFYDREAVNAHEGKQRNCRSVWEIPVVTGGGKHGAQMTPDLARRCILAGSARGDEVLDPFGGSGTVGVVCAEEGRSAMLIDLDDRATQQAKARTVQGGLLPLR